jgi:hypothetical protein
MLNRLADLVRLRAYSDLLVQPVGRISSTTLRDLAPGTPVIAYIELARADGTVRAAINGQNIELRLPFAARPGDNIALRVATQQPQLAFTLEPDGDPPAQLPQLSDTARFITALLAESDKLPVTKTATTGTPLLDNATHDARAIANALKTALADSGMFYEAHQAQWVADARPLAALLREPQSRLRPLEPRDPVRDSATTKDAPQLKELPVHRDALNVIRQQLQTLETHQVVWQGVLWPGQTIEWQVGEEAPDRAAPADDEHEWRSRVRMALPRLGGIDATLVVSSRGVRINLRADSEDGAHLLEANRRELRTALADAGVTPLGVGVVYAGA